MPSCIKTENKCKHTRQLAHDKLSVKELCSLYAHHCQHWTAQHSLWLASPLHVVDVLPSQLDSVQLSHKLYPYALQCRTLGQGQLYTEGLECHDLPRIAGINTIVS